MFTNHETKGRKPEQELKLYDYELFFKQFRMLANKMGRTFELGCIKNIQVGH